MIFWMRWFRGVFISEGVGQRTSRAIIKKDTNTMAT